MTMVKTQNFFQYLFLGENVPKIIIGDLLDTKESFLAFKNMHHR